MTMNIIMNSPYPYIKPQEDEKDYKKTKGDLGIRLEAGVLDKKDPP